MTKQTTVVIGRLRVKKNIDTFLFGKYIVVLLCGANCLGSSTCNSFNFVKTVTD